MFLNLIVARGDAIFILIADIIKIHNLMSLELCWYTFKHINVRLRSVKIILFCIFLDFKITVFIGNESRYIYISSFKSTDFTMN